MRHLPLLLAAAVAALGAFGQSANQVGAAPDFGTRYATDAYPGFDTDLGPFQLERKEPRWFAFINGPAKDTPEAQFLHGIALEERGAWGRAAKAYDALVREWPAAKEAPLAQARLAEILDVHEDDAFEAFLAYLYLVDFYSFQCDYAASVTTMHRLAGKMREEGKTILFFRFRNTVDVRRAFECCVLRAPGAAWAPGAMLTIAELREEAGDWEEAVKVYENVQNLHHGTAEATEACFREASVRMRILEDRGYNRERCVDTLLFLNRAETVVGDAQKPAVRAFRDALTTRLDDEDYRAASFYDSRMRTRRSAIRAYEQFLKDHPDSAHAETVRTRLGELTEGVDE